MLFRSGEGELDIEERGEDTTDFLLREGRRVESKHQGFLQIDWRGAQGAVVQRAFEFVRGFTVGCFESHSAVKHAGDPQDTGLGGIDAYGRG